MTRVFEVDDGAFAPRPPSPRALAMEGWDAPAIGPRLARTDRLAHPAVL